MGRLLVLLSLALGQARLAAPLTQLARLLCLFGGAFVARLTKSRFFGLELACSCLFQMIGRSCGLWPRKGVLRLVKYLLLVGHGLFKVDWGWRCAR